MNEYDVSESGFVGSPDNDFDMSAEIMDVEILHISKINVIARGRRYGRWWLLKGLIEQRRDSAVDHRQLQKEFELQSRLLVPGVAHAVGFEEIKGLGQCVVEEWVEGKALSELLQQGKLTKQERRRIMREIISIVSYIHSRGVAHRDLNPSNIIVRDAGGGVVFTDFGRADTDGYGDDIYSLGMIMKELCPEYSGIAARCTGPAKKRPNNTEKLLKSLNRHDRVPKVIWSISGVAVLVVLGILTGGYMNSLTAATQESQEKVLTLTEANRYQEKRMAQLTDSLMGAMSRMKSAEEAIKGMEGYNEMRKQAYLATSRRIDKTLDDFEKNIFPRFRGQELAFYDSIVALHNKLQYICTTSCNGKNFPDFKKGDSYKFYDEVVNHYLKSFSKHYMAWLAKLRNIGLTEQGVTKFGTTHIALDSIAAEEAKRAEKKESVHTEDPEKVEKEL